MLILLIELTIFSGCDHWGWSSKHRMSPNFHEDASGVSGEWVVDCLELWPPVSGPGISIAMIKILISRDSSLLWGIGVVNANLCGMNEIYSLS